MSATPRAKNEYSRGSGPSGDVSGGAGSRISGGSGGPRAAPFGRVGAAIFGSTLLAAILMVVAEFTSLYREQIGTSQPISISTGTHDSYALIPIAVLAVMLAFAVLRVGSRPALLAIAISGTVALLIALLGDLPDTNSVGVNPGCGPRNCVQVVRHPASGMYLETAGAILLIAASGLGFLLLGRPGPPAPRRAPPPDAAAGPPEPLARRPESGS